MIRMATLSPSGRIDLQRVNTEILRLEIAGLRLLSLYDRHRLKWPYRLPPSNGPPSLPSRNGLQNRSSFVPRVNGLPAPSHPTLSAALDDRR